jgi:two-component system sensor kinase FixL
VNKSVENVPQIIDDAAHLALVGARERSIRTLLDLDPKAKHVLADKVQMQQVLVNLMRNAVEAMASTAVRDLHITSRKRLDGYIEIGVETPVRAWHQIFSPASSKRLSAARRTEWVWACRSAGQSSRLTAGELSAELPEDGGTLFRFTLIDADAEDENGR